MSIDKAFIEWNKNPTTEQEEKFADEQAPDMHPADYALAVGFFGGYHAGQKTLSPEVREGIQRMIDALEGTSFDDTYEAARVGKKILEKME